MCEDEICYNNLKTIYKIYYVHNGFFVDRKKQSYLNLYYFIENTITLLTGTLLILYCI